MVDDRFFQNQGPFSLKELASFCGATLHLNGVDESKKITSLSTLDHATPDEICVLHNPKYVNALQSTNAGICVMEEKFLSHLPTKTAALLTDKPYKAYALIAQKFFPDMMVCEKESFIHPSASVDASAKLGSGVVVGPCAVIEAHVEIGDHSYVGANVVLSRGVKVGSFCYLSPNVVLSHTLMGDYVLVKPGAKIGQPGFGFHMDPSLGHVRVPQLGRVLIGSNVEIGANATIDRGSASDTIIEDGARIDNLVQIAHNVHIGKYSVIVAQVGIAGSTKIGQGTILAGQVGVAGHISIGNGVKVGAQSGIMRNVSDGEIIAGSPAVPIKEWHRQTIMLKKMVTPKKGQS